jgi:signal transduction histidine kinase/CheY-like chemotaxis protein
MTAVLSGAPWGSAVLLLHPGSTEALVLTALTLAGVMAGAISVLSYLFISFVGFALPIALPLAYHFLIQETGATEVIGVMVIIYLFGCVYFSHVFNRVVVESLRLRHANDALVADLQRQKQIAEDANIAKSKFLAAASHDLRQPLHALVLLVAGLKASRSGAERTAIYPRVEQSLQALSNLFNALLDISKLDAAAVVPKERDFSIKTVLDGCLSEFEAEARQKGLAVRARNCAVIAHSDPVLFERILRNLISNAVRYTERGGVLIACRPRRKGILFQVWDTGIGIPQARIPDVFEEFQQINNPQRDRSLGLGLGLAIVRRLCTLLGLPLELRSRVGRGTVVSVRLPRGTSLAAASTPTSAGRPAWDMNGRIVLIIDDERAVLQATGTLLEKWGCEAITAESGADACELLSGSGVVPDVILSDLRLRGEETGIDAIHRVRAALDHPIPAIVVTGDTSPDRIKLAHESGYWLLHKPLQPARLRAAMHRAIAGLPFPGEGS